ncbi:roadblock/LC7 domain-containing protein [Streptomyces sp. DSM 44915]|uniref:Roadblock/LC7 domain-containing protein n=1 Tax=Streptomyces chisholmiae TaxID=3075540 RepID=A0ABU2JL64_9ACTN|nr:roadblock/LC7 domain-containing protein [Streptomyces sp. DSM 44915]MDT0265657.1 roadblock/LC7 domain-containing protein [Streptomyces sp. DSM 44915]
MTSGTETRQQRPQSHGGQNLRWLLSKLVNEVPGVLSVAVVSTDGLPLLSTESGADGATTPLLTGPPTPRWPGGTPSGAAADLATVVSGLGSLTGGAASLMDGGQVKQTLVAMETGNLLVMAISDGSLLGVYTEPTVDISVVTYQMALLVGRAGHLLTPELRAELRQATSPY